MRNNKIILSIIILNIAVIAVICTVITGRALKARGLSDAVTQTAVAKNATTNKAIATETQTSQIHKATTKAITKATTARLGVTQNTILKYTLEITSDYPDIDPAMVMAIIEHESGFNRFAVNYNGTCHGLMQIYVYYNTERMKKLGVSDIYDAYGNISVGVNLLSELYNKYGNMQDALKQYSGGSESYYYTIINLMSKYSSATGDENNG